MMNLVATYFFEQKNARGYMIAYILTAVLLGCLSVISFSAEVMFWLIKIIQLIAFIGLGLLHTTATEKGLRFVEDKFQSKLSFTAVLTFLICASLFILYFFANRNMLVMALAGSCAFFLPYTVMQLWNMYRAINDSGNLTWYGYDDFLDTSDMVYLSSIPITFTLTTSEFDKEVIPFSIKAPLHMELSKVFNLFLVAAKNNYNINIESTDENNRPYGWQFFSASLKGLLHTQFDPEMSVGDNHRIKTDTIIFAKRVKATGTYHMPSQRETDVTVNRWM